MAVIKELIRTESNGAISFGDYSLAHKGKVEDFEFQGDVYKVKSFKEITKLEKNGMFVYESVPGTAVLDFQASDDGVKFQVEGAVDAQITLELEDGAEYDITIDNKDAGVMKTNVSGKMTLSVELEAETPVSVAVIKK